MWQALIAVALVSTALTRLVSFYFDIQAIAYLALVPLFSLSIGKLLLLLTPRRPAIRKMDPAIRRMDIVMGTVVAFPLLIAPLSLAMAMGTSFTFPMGQFAKQIIWSVLMYSAYFAARFVPPRTMPFVFYAFLIIVGASVPIIFLQQLGLVSQFYWVSNTVFLSSYVDASGISRFRNTGFFGYAHDAGDAMLLLMLAAHALYLIAAQRRTKFLALAGALITFSALVLTSSRATAVLGVLTIVTSLLVLEPLLTLNPRTMLRGVLRFSGIVAMGMLAIWAGYEIAPNFFSSTLWFSRGFSFLSQGDRISETTEAIGYLLSDPLRGLFGWGQGTGGLAPVQGIKILPVNTVDTTIAATLANFGLFGLAFYAAAFSIIIWDLAKIRHTIYLQVRQKQEGTLTLVLCQFSLLAMWALLLSFIVGYAVTDRIYCNFAFLCFGALMSRCARISRNPTQLVRKRPYALAPRLT